MFIIYFHGPFSIANRFTSPEPFRSTETSSDASREALEAQKQGWFKEEIVPVTIETKGKERPSKRGRLGPGPNVKQRNPEIHGGLSENVGLIFPMK